MAARKSAAAKQASASDDSASASTAKKGKGKNRAAALQQALGKGDHESVSWGAMRQLHDDAGGSIETTPEGKEPIGDIGGEH